MSDDILDRTIPDIARLVASGEVSAAVPDAVRVERPRNREHGDWSTNLALQLAKGAGVAPRALADVLARRLAETDRMLARG